MFRRFGLSPAPPAPLPSYPHAAPANHHPAPAAPPRKPHPAANLNATRPDKLIAALNSLSNSSKRSAPDLSDAVANLAEIFQQGQQTRDNRKGLNELKKNVETLNVFAKEIRIESLQQKKLVNAIKQELDSIHEDVEEEENLDLFNYTTADSDINRRMNKLRELISQLEAEACPDVCSYYTMNFDFSGASVDTTSAKPGDRCDVGSFNAGRQRQVYRQANIKAPGSVASQNDATARANRLPGPTAAR